MSQKTVILPEITNITTDCAMFRNALRIWSNSYADDAVIIQNLFNKYPANADLQMISKKVDLLDTKYKTKLRAQGAKKQINLIQIVSRAICNSDFDARVITGDKNLVDDLRRTVQEMGGNDCLSFTTKYCSFHNPTKYPIYDSKVSGLLKSANDQYHFTNNPKINTCDSAKSLSFVSWHAIVTDFQRTFAPDLSLLELDRFLFGFAKQYM